MTLQNFVKKKPYLFWSIDPRVSLSNEAIVEAVLNYGDFSDVRKVMAILGSKKVAAIFYRDARKKRSNYDAKIKHFFSLYFKPHA